MTLNVGINGFGRIGRIIFRTCLQNPYLKVSAINDPAVDIDYICYLIKFDSTHGKFKGNVGRTDNVITVNGHKITIFREKLPVNIPWYLADVHYVVEASGIFTNLEKASGHLASESVKHVLVTAPSLDVPMVVMGVNEDILKAGHKVISCASSTLYCLAPIIKILEEQFGVSEGFITSIHAMTPSLKPLDGLCLKGKHWRDHRSILQNIIPATTGACRALGKIIPQVKDKLTGLAFRVPIVNVSVLDITVRLKSSTTINGIVKHVENARKSNMHNVIKVSDEQAVSSDFVGETFSCILDSESSLQLTSDFFKLICWYENELSYACRIIDSIFFLERQYQFEWKLKTSYIRPTPKPSLIQQMTYPEKMTYHQVCTYKCHGDTKSLCSTSQDSGFKSPKRQQFPKKKPVYSRNFGTHQVPYTNRGSKNNELFKVTNDVDEIVKTPMRQNRSSFFQSCVAVSPQLNTNMSVKTQERLEKVKREFSKMVNMTENLLKQSQHSKIEIDLPVVLSNDICDTNIQKIVTKTNYNECKAPENDENTSKDNSEIKENITNIFSIVRDNNETTYVSQQKETENINLNLTLNHGNDIENKNTAFNNINTKYLAALKRITGDSVKQKIIEKTFIDNNYVKQGSTLTNTNKGKNDWPNCTVDKNDISLSVRDDEESTPCDNNSYSDTKSGVASAAEVNNNGKETSKEDDANKCEKKNIDSYDEKERHLQIRLEGILKKLALSTNAVSEKPSASPSTINTITTVSNRDIKHKQDIYDKLDSVSATDSENSFHMKERKSQVINITDLTNSLEDLERLDKICRIIEISDELSDQLLSTLNTADYKEIQNKKWSFKDLCEKIKLDEFCNKIFSKNI